MAGKKKMKLFGTDGIRGKANHYPMTGEIAFEVGRAAAYVLRKKHGRNRILIGRTPGSPVICSKAP